jgi:hypothetical protein
VRLLWQLVSSLLLALAAVVFPSTAPTWGTRALAGLYDSEKKKDSNSESSESEEDDEEEEIASVSSDTDDEREKQTRLQLKVMRIARGVAVHDLETPRAAKKKKKEEPPPPPPDDPKASRKGQRVLQCCSHP